MDNEQGCQMTNAEVGRTGVTRVVASVGTPVATPSRATAEAERTGAPLSAVPAFLSEALTAQYGAELAGRIVEEGYAARRVVSLRANALRSSALEIAGALDAAGIAHESVPWYADAFVLPDVRERAVWELPVYEQGKLYLQSLSSMLPPLALAPREGADVLDMCAAPGGKTTQLAALSGGHARITACEMNGPRAEKLAFNLRRQGAESVNVMRTDARRLDDFFSFDQILLDAPCSGSGTASLADPKLAQHLTPQLVAKSVKAQSALLAKALRLLKPGGELVYSTCSILAAENEDVVRSALRKSRCKVVPIALPGMASELPLLPTTLEGALLVRPTDRYEGFFLVKLRRLG